MRRVATLLLASAAAACLPTRPLGSPEGWPRADWIVDARTGEKTHFDALIADLSSADVIFVGEDHDNPHHHEMQRRIASALLEKRPDLAVGLEMLQTTYQPAADRYVSGAIDLDAFAEETKWKRNWGFPIALYRPILELAREKKAPLIALNAPEAHVKRVREAGVDGLTPEDREMLPELDFGNARHEAFVRNAIEKHHSMSEDRIRRAYAVQVLWDETMAETTVKAMKNGGGTRRPVMVIAGTGHVINRLGIPSRVERRVPDAKTRVVLALPRQAVKGAIAKVEGDWLWVAPLTAER